MHQSPEKTKNQLSLPYCMYIPDERSRQNANTTYTSSQPNSFAIVSPVIWFNCLAVIASLSASQQQQQHIKTISDARAIYTNILLTFTPRLCSPYDGLPYANIKFLQPPVLLRYDIRWSDVWWSSSPQCYQRKLNSQHCIQQPLHELGALNIQSYSADISHF